MAVVVAPFDRASFDRTYGRLVSLAGNVATWPSRFGAFEVPSAIDALPALDAILVSHDHFDHLDFTSVLALAKHTAPTTPFVTSLGVGPHLEHFGVPSARIVELDWHESFTVPGKYLRFAAQPAQHFSGRGFGFAATTLWSSWVIAGPEHRVFFSGDTGLTDEFSAIGSAHAPFDLVMLEVGAYHPSWGTIHLGPENALLAHRMLGGGTLLPVHWGTFDLALHAWNEPAETLLTHATKTGTRAHAPTRRGLRSLAPRRSRPLVAQNAARYPAVTEGGDVPVAARPPKKSPNGPPPSERSDDPRRPTTPRPPETKRLDGFRRDRAAARRSRGTDSCP